jgi:site-specific recombinase XerD
MTTPSLGPLVQSFFLEHLITIKGLRPASVRSYRDTIRLFLLFVAANKRSKITRLQLADLSFERVIAFLRYLEHDRGNHIRTRNQRLAALHTLFDYIATRAPEMLGVCQRVMAIPMKRAAPAETKFLERDEIEHLFADLPHDGRLALRDRALLLFLYNSGARVQEIADLRVGNLDLGEHPLARLHGKGDKWRTCRSGNKPRTSFASCSPPRIHRRRPTPPCSPRRADRSPASASTRSSDVTPPTWTTRALTGPSARTRSGTPRPFTCWRPASRST